MKERFTPAAQKAIDRAQELASILRAGKTGAEHLFLALLEEQSVIAILRNIGIDPLLIRKECEGECEHSSTDRPHLAKPPFQRRLDILIELAGDIRRWMGGTEVGPHHLLLALVNDPNGFPATMLRIPEPSSADIYEKIIGILRTGGIQLESELPDTGKQWQLGELLQEMDLLTEDQIREALEVQRTKGGAIGDILVELGYITREELLLALGSQMGMELANLGEIEIPLEVINLIPAAMAKAYNVIPVRFENNVLTVAMANPHDINVLDDLRNMCHCEVQGAVASEEAVLEALEKYYGHKLVNLGEVLERLGVDDLEFQGVKDRRDERISDIDELVNSAPVVKLLNLILATAIKAQSSDIHFEPFENVFKVRYRVEGVLYEMEAPPLHLALPIVSRLKVLANLDVDERQLPQDGQITMTLSGRPYRLLVSTLPTSFGESVVVHVFKET